jgi:hypothetical protein
MCVAQNSVFGTKIFAKDKGFEAAHVPWNEGRAGGAVCQEPFGTGSGTAGCDGGGLGGDYEFRR